MPGLMDWPCIIVGPCLGLPLIGTVSWFPCLILWPWTVFKILPVNSGPPCLVEDCGLLGAQAEVKLLLDCCWASCSQGLVFIYILTSWFSGFCPACVTCCYLLCCNSYKIVVYRKMWIYLEIKHYWSLITMWITLLIISFPIYTIICYL